MTNRRTKQKMTSISQQSTNKQSIQKQHGIQKFHNSKTILHTKHIQVTEIIHEKTEKNYDQISQQYRTSIILLLSFLLLFVPLLQWSSCCLVVFSLLLFSHFIFPFSILLIFRRLICHFSSISFLCILVSTIQLFSPICFIQAQTCGKQKHEI